MLTVGDNVIPLTIGDNVMPELSLGGRETAMPGTGVWNGDDIYDRVYVGDYPVNVPGSIPNRWNNPNTHVGTAPIYTDVGIHSGGQMHNMGRDLTAEERINNEQTKLLISLLDVMTEQADGNIKTFGAFLNNVFPNLKIEMLDGGERKLVLGIQEQSALPQPIQRYHILDNKDDEQAVLKEFLELAIDFKKKFEIFKATHFTKTAVPMSVLHLPRADS